MADQIGANDLPSSSNCSESSNDYLARAARACEAGDLVLGMHLYLAAYEKAAADPDIPDGMALAGLQEAWELACSLKERSMAEYVFEKLEPFLTSDEIPEYANELQNLALDRLEEYGFSREELADMAEMISQDLMGETGSIVKVESFSIPKPEGSDELSDLMVDEVDPLELDAGPAEQPMPEPPSAAAGAEKGGKPEQIGMGVATVDDFNPYDFYNTSSVGTSYHAATNDGSGEYVFTRDEDRAEESRRAREEPSAPQFAGGPKADGQAESEAVARDPKQASSPVRAVPDDAPDDAPARVSATAGPSDSAEGEADADGPAEDAALAAQAIARNAPTSVQPAPEHAQTAPGVLRYRSLVGYDEAVSVMRDFGIGLQRDAGFQNFVKMMNARHGLSSAPSLDTVLFRSPVIEDASRFLDATIGEIGLPVLRMSMEENVQGMPMLCVAVQGSSRPRMNHAHNRFEGPGILVIEDLDMWALPSPPEGMEGIGNFMMANISRGAREAVNLIHSAVEDPDVYVLATATTHGDVDPFFYDLLEPMTVIDIGYPTDREREAIWSEIMHDHPSMRKLDRAVLTRLSAGLARFDIYLAAREAVEEAYKLGLVQRRYVPVTPQNAYDKLAACQPVDSEEYRSIEDEVVRSFRDDLDHLEDLLEDSRS